MENKELIQILESIAKLSRQFVELKEDLTKKQPKTISPARSADIKDLCAALAKAQAEIKIAGLTKENPYFKSRYADLAEMIKVSRPSLTKNGLSIVQQIVQNEDGQNILNTIMLHSSGQWIESRMRIVPPKNDVQSMGSYITYLKRYAYGSLVGVVASDEDDDGEVAVHDYREDFNKGTGLNHKYNPKEQSYETITKEQLEELRYELKSHADLAEEIMEKMKIQSLSDMPKTKYSASIRRIREIVQKRDGK